MQLTSVRPTLFAATAAAALLAFAGSASATTATFNFDSDATGTFTPFTDTNNGISAAFSSPADPGGFGIIPASSTGFVTLSGQVLIDPGPAGANNIPLDITFSQQIASISFLFALNDPSNTTSMDLSTGAGGTASATGTIPPNHSFPEGSLSFSGKPFTTVTLSSLAPDFAIDDLVVTTPSASVPEPGSLLLLAAG